MSEAKTWEHLTTYGHICNWSVESDLTESESSTIDASVLRDLCLYQQSNDQKRSIRIWRYTVNTTVIYSCSSVQTLFQDLREGPPKLQSGTLPGSARVLGHGHHRKGNLVNMLSSYLWSIPLVPGALYIPKRNSLGD